MHRLNAEYSTRKKLTWAFRFGDGAADSLRFWFVVLAVVLAVVNKCSVFILKFQLKIKTLRLLIY